MGYVIPNPVYTYISNGGAHSVMVTVIGNGHSNMSSIPGQDCLCLT